MGETIRPISKSERIEVLDVIRGFAIFGILMANIQSWSGYKFMPFEVMQRLSYYEFNDILHHLFMIFIDTKFYTLFSLLFGIGFYIQFRKFRDEQTEFIKTYRRRLAFLMLFGAIHAFFWSGDILLIYGLVGFFFILFRNLPPKRLLLVAVFFYYVWVVKDIVIFNFFPDFIQHYQATSYKTYVDLSPEALMLRFQSGTFFEVLHANWHNLYWRYVDLFPAGRLSIVLALFLFGYYLMMIGYFQKWAKSKRLMLLFWIGGLFFTMLADQIGGSMSKFATEWMGVLYKIVAITGQILLTMAYVNTLTILYEKIPWRTMLHPLSYVGRMSFSNYIMHTLFGYLIFYPFFGQLFGKMSLVEILVLSIVLYTFQIGISWLWLKYFRFGPLEWLWRCLTYGKWFPLRRE
ncbi:DUF418 domain-containing protein [Hydrogenimonas sp.]|uniref:DUF418 domain-containing protein n=1 Tax=Hydrogenimonas sp. TaxID=2231112 RepID=UPI0026172871|nr:DUF418 domain-containing protein [Hydrogenimonas sp.]